MTDQIKEKPVTVTLDVGGDQLQVMHRCDTVVEAEQWIADFGDPVHSVAGNYGIDAPEEAINAYYHAPLEETEVPVYDEESDISRALRLLGVFCNPDATQDDLDEAFTEGNELLGYVKQSGDHEMLVTFDQVVSRGRAELIEHIERGDPFPDIMDDEDIHRIVSNALNEVDRLDQHVRRPMTFKQLNVLLRRRAGALFRALYTAPLYFAVPGMRRMLEDVEEVLRVPVVETLEEEDPEAFAMMQPFVVSADQFDQGSKTVTVGQIVAVSEAARRSV